MRRVLRYGLNQTVAAIVVSCLIAGAVTMMTRPSSADAPGATSISVNRALKGNRLPLAKTPRQKHDALPTPADRSAPTSMGRPPLGCDPAFSPIVDPGRRLRALRCLT